MKVLIYILGCALIGCFIISTYAGWIEECHNKGGEDLTQVCRGSYGKSECSRTCRLQRNAEKGICIKQGCCCLNETDGFAYGTRWK